MEAAAEAACQQAAVQRPQSRWHPSAHEEEGRIADAPVPFCSVAIRKRLGRSRAGRGLVGAVVLLARDHCVCIFSRAGACAGAAAVVIGPPSVVGGFPAGIHGVCDAGVVVGLAWRSELSGCA